MVIPKDSVIKAIKKDEGFGLGVFYEEAISWLMDEYESTMKTYSKYIPNKARKGREDWPFFLWMAPSLHDNYEESNYQKRKKFTQVLEQCVKNKKATSLRLKTTWNPHDNKFYTLRDRRFTPAGWLAFWESVDNSIQYFDTKIIPEIVDSEDRRRNNQFRNLGAERDRPSTSSNHSSRKWLKNRLHHGQPSSHARSMDRRQDNTRRNQYRLPTPPPKRF